MFAPIPYEFEFVKISLIALEHCGDLPHKVQQNVEGTFHPAYPKAVRLLVNGQHLGLHKQALIVVYLLQHQLGFPVSKHSHLCADRLEKVGQPPKALDWPNVDVGGLGDQRVELSFRERALLLRFRLVDFAESTRPDGYFALLLLLMISGVNLSQHLLGVLLFPDQFYFGSHVLCQISISELVTSSHEDISLVPGMALDLRNRQSLGRVESQQAVYQVFEVRVDWHLLLELGPELLVLVVRHILVHARLGVGAVKGASSRHQIHQQYSSCKEIVEYSVVLNAQQHLGAFVGLRAAYGCGRA